VVIPSPRGGVSPVSIKKMAKTLSIWMCGLKTSTATIHALALPRYVYPRAGY